MNYKVGDKVRIKSKEWYESHKNKFGKVWTVCLSGEGTICFDQDNAEYCGKVLTIAAIEPENYAMVGNSYAWTDEMIEGLAEELLDKEMEEHQKLCDEIMAIQGIEPIEAEMEQIIHCPDGYIFKDENGNVINAKKIVLEKKKKEYPKTYEECCYVTGFENTEMVFEDDYRDINPPKEQWKRLGLINQLNKLIICRDAYWKIAGEEMGLGKPWEPDYDSGVNKYGIICMNGVIQESNPTTNWERHLNKVLDFPTAEMRDAFKENFDKDLEFCKELL